MSKVSLFLKAKTPGNEPKVSVSSGPGTMHYIVEVEVDDKSTGVSGHSQVIVTNTLATLNDGKGTITFQ